jgi:hypothetical protein
MTAPQRPPDQSSPVARGVVLLVVAVVIGAFFLARGNSGSLLGNQGSAGANASATTSAPTSSTTPPTTPPTMKPATATKIAVYNGTGGKVSSAAGNSRTKLVSVGYTQGNISINDTAQLPTSAIYYQPTVNQTDAAAVATALGFPTTTVQPAQAAAPNAIPASAKGSDIVVLIGLDQQNNAALTGPATTGTSSTTSTPGTSSTTSTTGTSSTTSTTG